MPVHIGKIIQTEVENKRLTQKEFGALINKHEKTVPDIYARASMSIDLLITISEALNKDFLNIFYDEDPMKSLRNDEIEKLNLQIQNISAENKRLQRELALIYNLAEAQKETISFAKEQIEQYKLRLTELPKIAKSDDNTNKESSINVDYSPENKV
jgi:transcriptional regulator with XRE-family HTH domain